MPDSSPSSQMDVESGHQLGNSATSYHPATKILKQLQGVLFQLSQRSKPKTSPEAQLDPWWVGNSKPYVREICKFPRGWPQVSAAIDSDANFMIYRRFGYLRTRLLVYHQDVLREMEAKLDELDRNDFEGVGTKCGTSNRQQDDARQPALRKGLFQALNAELQTYDDLLIRSQRLYGFDIPSKRNQQSIRDILWNDNWLSHRDGDYIRHEDDLITFDADKETSWVHKVLGKLFHWAPQSLSRHLFRSDIQSRKAMGNTLGILPFRRVRFNRGVEYVFALFSILTLIGPIYILNAIRDKSEYVQNTAVFISTALFAFLLSSATAAKRHEVFAATSA